MNRRASKMSAAARREWAAAGMGTSARRIAGITPVPRRTRIEKRPMRAKTLNEAYDYPVPSSFSRGMRVELPGATMLFISGTASIDEKGRSVHRRDFRAQCVRTFRNITELLASEGASWHDIVRTTCYLKDIKMHYGVFNEMRTLFMESAGLDPLPASTGIQAELCRPELLVEIEAIAVIPRGRR